MFQSKYIFISAALLALNYCPKSIMRNCPKYSLLLCLKFHCIFCSAVDNKNSTTKWAAKCLGTKYRPSAFIIKKGVFQGQEPRNWGHNNERMNLESIQCIKMDYLRPNCFSLELVSRPYYQDILFVLSIFQKNTHWRLVFMKKYCKSTIEIWEGGFSTST